jgi:hypothetical protein
VISFVLNGTRHVAAKVRSSPDQAVRPTEWVSRNHEQIGVPAGWTALWEMVFDENRIVIRYDREGLPALAW